MGRVKVEGVLQHTRSRNPFFPERNSRNPASPIIPSVLSLTPEMSERSLYT